MDRRNRLRLAASGLGLLMMTTGCRSLLHRHEVPPEPPAQETTPAPARFGSDPQAMRAASTPAMPTGPTASGAGMYGPSSPSAGRPLMTPQAASSGGGAPGGAPDPFETPAPTPNPAPSATPSSPSGALGPMGSEAGPG